MKQEELLQQYNTLKTALDYDDITEKKFQESVDQLRYEDKQGIWHQIDAETGRWLYWKDNQWQLEPKSSQTKRSADSTKPNTNPQQQLPQGFWSLFGLIFTNTIKMFFKKLPSTLFFMFLALVLHTFLLVVVNNGFNAEKFIGNFLSLSFDPSKGASPLNGIIVWTVVPMIIMSLFAPKSSSPGLGDRLSTIVTYFRVAKKDAMAMILGSLGVSLAVGALMNGYSSLVLAVGVGTLFASKSGSVVALLFRSAWTSIFNSARRENISRHGLAAGYVAIFASSVGFIVNSALTPYGIAIGIILLFVAIIMAKGVPISSAVAPLLIPGLILLGNSFFGFDLLWAHDGGFNDPAGGGGTGTFKSWWDGTSRNLAIFMGIPPAIGAGFALLIQRVLQEMADDLPPDGNRFGGGTLLDENGNPLEQREDGLYGWEVGDETQWLTREEAEEQIQEELDARRRRDQEREDFWKDVERDKAADREKREQNLVKEGYKWDPDKDAWVHEGPLPGDPKLDEIYRRGDWIRDHMSDLTPEQQAAAQRILDRIGADETGVDPDDISDKDIDDIRRLTRAMNDLNTGKSEMDGAKAQIEAIDQANRVNIAQRTALAGRMAAGLVEATFVPWTRGAVSGFVFGAAESREKGAHKAIYDGFISSVANFVGNKLGVSKQGNVKWNMFTSGLTAAAESGAKGGSTEDMKNSAFVGAIFGGITEAAQNAEVEYRTSVEPELTRIQAGEDPTLMPGSRGLGSDDLTGRTSSDIRMDMEYRQNQLEAHKRIGAFDEAVQSGDPIRIRKTVNELLEHRNSKLLMKGDDVSIDLKSKFAEYTQEYRTNPVFEGTADNLNAQKLPDGQNRYYVVDENGVKRAVTMDDFVTGSGAPVNAPGVDFDMYAQTNIVDGTTGKTILPVDLENAVGDTSRNLGFDMQNMETNVMHPSHLESYPIKPNETPREFLGRASGFDGYEAQQATEIAGFKGIDAGEIHGAGSANALSEACRGSTKDFNRITQPMIDSNPKAEIPKIFTLVDPDTGKTAIQIMEDVGKGRTATGTGNAQFRDLTRMSLEEGVTKLNSLPEAFVKLRKQ